MRIAQEGGFASDEETLDPCTYRLVHMFRTMLNSKIQAGAIQCSGFRIIKYDKH